MMNFLLKAIVHIINRYSGKEPLATFLKKYFKSQPQLGSRDRKAISEAVYIYFRCAPFLPHDQSPLEVIARGFYRCDSQNRFLGDQLAQAGLYKNPVPRPGWRETEKIWAQSEPFSNGITMEAWQEAMYYQPALFIRARKPVARVYRLLRTAGIGFEPIPAVAGTQECASLFKDEVPCLRLANGTKLMEVLPEETYVVQDWASQAVMAAAIRVGAAYKATRPEQKQFNIWDVCAGAGGKSIFWKDRYPEDRVMATDIRQSILSQLKRRFLAYGIDGFDYARVDASRKDALGNKMQGASFDFLICDVPCSGSGTWGRTPEQFYFFGNHDLTRYAHLQYTISFNAQKYLRVGGLLFYITCSVFRQENEAVVARLVKHTGLVPQHQELINGASLRGDALFIAILRKEIQADDPERQAAAMTSATSFPSFLRT